MKERECEHHYHYSVGQAFRYNEDKDIYTNIGDSRWTKQCDDCKEIIKLEGKPDDIDEVCLKEHRVEKQVIPETKQLKRSRAMDTFIAFQERIRLAKSL